VKRVALPALVFVLIVGSSLQAAGVSGGFTSSPPHLDYWEIRIQGKTEVNPISTISTPLFEIWWKRVPNYDVYQGEPFITKLLVDGVVVATWSVPYAETGAPYAPTPTLYHTFQPTGSIADGEHTWGLQFSHGPYSGSRGGPFRVDTSPPVLQSFQINGGAAYTNSPTVTVSLSASDYSGVTEMSFSWDGTAWSSWEGYQTSKSLTLPAGDGQKSIHVRLRDVHGHVSSPTLATIILDQTPPSIASFTINGGAAYTSSTSASLGIDTSDATSGLDVMQFSLDGTNWTAWESYSSSKSLTLPAGDGQKMIYFRVRDKAGNVGTKSATITLDQTPPVVGAVIPSVTNFENIVVNLSSSSDALAGIAGVKLWREGENEPVTWEGFATSKQAILPAGDGPKKLYVRLRDAVGNESALKEVSTTLDKTPPSIQVLEPVGVEIIGNKLKVKASLSDALVGLDQNSIEALLNSLALENVVFENNVLSFEVEVPYGTYSIQLKAKDLAGNLASKIFFVALKPQPQTSSPQPSQPTQPPQPSQPQPVIAMTVPERLANGDKLRVVIRVSNPTSSPIVKRLVLRFNRNELPLEFGVQSGQEVSHEAELDVPPNAVGTFAVVLADVESGSVVANGNVTLGAAAPSDEQPSPASSSGVPAHLAALAVALPAAVAAIVILNHRRASRTPRLPKRIPPTTSPKTRQSGTRPDELTERMRIHRRYREHPD